MLVLTRKLNECITINSEHEKIEIHVLHISKGKVKIGINASDAIRIRRSEIPPVKGSHKHIKNEDLKNNLAI